MGGEAIPDMVRADEAEARKREEDEDTHDRLMEDAHNQRDPRSNDPETIKRSAGEQVEKVTRAMPKADSSI